MKPTDRHKRIEELLAKLVRLADSCRDLYALQTRLQFLNLATSAELGFFLPNEDLSALSAEQLETLSSCLESWWREPALAAASLNRELLRHRAMPSIQPVRRNSPAPADRWNGVIARETAGAGKSACHAAGILSP
ncbi:MAG: hypothetical protein PHD76_05945 [Methylacidiphilales bacterium]|nr:hypothetical protein [Candidatus Methylacidiphilales bacterium]